jgi:O-antigen/teichoic acid export membrane protein
MFKDRYRISFFLSVIVIVLAGLAGPILTLWVGTGYAALAGVVVILVVANFMAAVQWPATAVLQGMARHRILALSTMASGLAIKEIGSPGISSRPK